MSINPQRVVGQVKMSKRKRIRNAIAAEVLLESRRRCCLCFGLENNLKVRDGQLAHLDRDPSNNALDNLAFLCLRHHNLYDTRPSQAKGFTIDEVKRHRAHLYAHLRNQPAGVCHEFRLLPFLVNRKEQADAVVRLIIEREHINSNGHIYFIVHGDEYQCHRQFIDCVVHYYCSQGVGLSAEAKMKPVHLLWPSAYRDYSDLENHLLRRLRSQAPSCTKPNHIDLAESFYNAHRRTIMLCTCISTQQLARQGIKAPFSFFRFCRQWPAQPRERPLIACILIKYATGPCSLRLHPIVKLFMRFLAGRQSFAKVNRSMRDLLSANSLIDLGEQLRAAVIPELYSIDRSDVEHWANTRVVQNVCRNLLVESRVREIYQDYGHDLIPMEDLAPLLESHILQRQES